jgi:hypothetical protein
VCEERESIEGKEKGKKPNQTNNKHTHTCKKKTAKEINRE